MYFIIAIWGGPRRVYASIKFMIYTLIGSVLMLLGILTLYFQHYTQFQTYSFDIADLMRTQLPDAMQWWVFWAFFVGFAVKVPMFPFHTWLPDAHTEAPTAGSVVLASVLLKMGTYGFLRFSLPLLPDSAKNPVIINAMAMLSIIGIVYGALASPDAEGLEEAGGLLLGEPPGLLHAGHLLAESGGHLRLDPAADQSRHFDRHALPDRRRRLRAAPHARDLRVRRAAEGDAGLHHRLPAGGAQFHGHAAAERLHRRIHDPARRIPDVVQLGLLGRGRHRARRGVPAVAVPADHARRGEGKEPLLDLSWREIAVFAPLIVWAFWIGLNPQPYFRVLERPVAQIVERVRPGYYAERHLVNPLDATTPLPSASLR